MNSKFDAQASLPIISPQKSPKETTPTTHKTKRTSVTYGGSNHCNRGVQEPAMEISEKKICTNTACARYSAYKQALFLIGFDIKPVNFQTTIIISPPYSNLEYYLGSWVDYPVKENGQVGCGNPVILLLLGEFDPYTGCANEIGIDFRYDRVCWLTEYEIDVKAEQREKHDYNVYCPDQHVTWNLHRLALQYCAGWRCELRIGGSGLSDCEDDLTDDTLYGIFLVYLVILEFSHAQSAIVSLFATDHSQNKIDRPATYGHPAAPVSLDWDRCLLGLDVWYGRGYGNPANLGLERG